MGSHAKGSNWPLIIGILVALAACAGLVVAIWFLLLAPAPSPAGAGSASDGASFEQLEAQDRMPGSGSGAIPKKLRNATETVDERGVIHGETEDGITYQLIGRGNTGSSPDSVTLVAAGDQIATTMNMPIADGYAGERGDGQYSFVPFYKEVAPFIQSYDLRYINQETCMAGEERGYSGYPIFNSPDACGEALGAVGFNVVSFATNHTLDCGVDGALRTLDVLDRNKDMAVVGSYRSPEDRNEVRLIECNGKTFAFLAYTYGDNSSGTVENFPNQHILCGFDKDVMQVEIERAQQVADAVIVIMHWGSEYTVEPNEQQWDYAQFLADLDVDLVLGSHAHSMQPVKNVVGKDGHVTPVVFGLSDFLSGWTITDTILSGLFTCEFTWDGDERPALSNLAWYPTIEWSDGGDTYVRFLKDMDADTTNVNTRTEDVGNDYEYLRDMVNSSGMDIPVVM